MADEKKLTPQDAVAFLYSRLHVPVFMNKLAGAVPPQYVPSTQEELQLALEKAAQLHAAEQEVLVEQAAHNSPLRQACGDLDYLLGNNSPPATDAVFDQQVKQASASLVEDPEIAQALAALA